MAEELLNYARLDDPPDLADHNRGRILCANDELRVVDNTSDQVVPGKEGGLLVRSPCTFDGSFRSDYNKAITTMSAALILKASPTRTILLVAERTPR
ncbi:hypothetical protein [Mycobacterium uberis]|uniref:hypothetical protein n=1 Tax=Mycobacterium uberis TaxID=2162698 RepID=UPI001058F263|nr:hypothetical protein [Mycobacterium uberis]